MNEIKLYNHKGNPHGYWERSVVVNNGHGVQYRCFYNNGQEIGYEEFNSHNTKILKKKYHLR